MIENLVTVESPFAAKTKEESRDNIRYVLACMRHVFMAGKVPFAGHLLYPLVLDDTSQEQRRLGMKSANVIANQGARWFFMDRGLTPGMKSAQTIAQKISQPTREIVLGHDWPNLIKDIGPAAIDGLVTALTESKNPQ